MKISTTQTVALTIMTTINYTATGRRPTQTTLELHYRCRSEGLSLSEKLIAVVPGSYLLLRNLSQLLPKLHDDDDDDDDDDDEYYVSIFVRKARDSNLMLVEFGRQLVPVSSI